MDKNKTIVKAHKMDNIHIYYECPYCWSKYKKNGEPTKTAKRITHQHGSDNDYSNRTENRISHCYEPNKSYAVNIIIDDTTKKVDDPLLRKRFEKLTK
jgi:hypothetical protein